MNSAEHHPNGGLRRGTRSGTAPVPSRISSTSLRVVLGALLSLLCVACSSGESDSSTSSSATSAMGSPSPTGSDATTGAALHHRGSGYALALPEGWTAAEPLESKWPVGARPELNSAGFTTFASADARTQLAIGSRPVAPRTTLPGWRRQLTAAHELDYPQCERVGPSEPTRLGGMPAVRRWLSCETVEAVGDLTLTLNRNRGWAVLCSVSVTSRAATHQTCEGLLEEFHFES